MLVPIYIHSYTLCGQLVIVGGERDRSPVKFIHQLIDGKWVKISPLSTGRVRCFIVSPSPEKIVIVGGVGEDSVEEFVVV